MDLLSPIMNTFCKSERLCNKNLFEELVHSDFSFVKFPFRVLVKKSSLQGEYPARMGISVSKKKFKRAVKRNRLKRLAREAYRMHKSELYKDSQGYETLDILFIYIDNTVLEYSKIEKAIQSAIQKIIIHFYRVPE